jgi:hypothetical protein
MQINSIATAYRHRIIRLLQCIHRAYKGAIAAHTATAIAIITAAASL